MGRLEAQRTLDSLRMSGLRLPAESLFDLVFAATEDREFARRAMHAQIKADHRAARPAM